MYMCTSNITETRAKVVRKLDQGKLLSPNLTIKALQALKAWASYVYLFQCFYGVYLAASFITGKREYSILTRF